MLDITLLRKDLDSVITRLQTRKNPQAFLDVAAFTALEAERKTVQMHKEDVERQRNVASKRYGQLKGLSTKGGEEGAAAGREAAILLLNSN